MKKVFMTILVLVTALALMGGVALAGGWTAIDYDASHDPDDIYTGTTGPPSDGIAVWNPEDGAEDYDGSGLDSPHGGFSTSTNRCRVCHAVHLAGAGSWRLLQDGTNVDGEDRGMDRASECNFCHGVTGATQKRPYRPKSYTVLGEHTIGSTVIPDSDSNTAVSNGGLSCGNCHTVHGAGALNTASPALATGTWVTMKILWLDPNQDGSELAAGYDGAASASELASSYSAVKTGFCADCHNANPNWNTSEDPSAESTRANPRSHVQGPAADGSLEVYGTTMTVAGWSTIDGNGDGGSKLQNTVEGCRACHKASDKGNSSEGTTATASAFPHQTKGAKLLFDTFTQDNVVQQSAQTGGWGSKTNDANRVLPRMDQLCGKCHIKGGDIDNPEDTEGVGQSF